MGILYNFTPFVGLWGPLKWPNYKWVTGAITVITLSKCIITMVSFRPRRIGLFPFPMHFPRFMVTNYLLDGMILHVREAVFPVDFLAILAGCHREAILERLFVGSLWFGAKV